MKRFFLFSTLYLIGIIIIAQERENPLVKSFGGIYDVPHAAVKPDNNIKYNIVIDVASGSGPETVNDALYNVARLLNLHAIGGVPPENLNIVLAIHANSTHSIMTNDGYSRKYGFDNPNIDLIKELKDSGVKLTVCGQSLLARDVKPEEIVEEVEIATSMLTVVTTYQLLGYAVLKF